MRQLIARRLRFIAALMLAASLTFCSSGFAQVYLPNDILQKAAAGDGPSEAMVGGAYATAQNYDQARAWFARAAQHGYPYASGSIAQFDAQGLGHHTGPDKAILPSSGAFTTAAPSLDPASVAANLQPARAIAAKNASNPALIDIAVDSGVGGGWVTYDFVAGGSIISVTSNGGVLNATPRIAPAADNDNTTPLPSHFLDLAAALSSAKSKGMTSDLQSASLTVQHPAGRPARAIWQIVGADDNYYYVDAAAGSTLAHSDYSEDEFPAMAARTNAMRKQLAAQQAAQNGSGGCPKPPMFAIGANYAAPFAKYAFCRSHPGCVYFAGSGEATCP